MAPTDVDEHKQNGRRNGRESAPREDDDFPTYQLTILAICRFSEPIAFSSILAYTYIMVQDLNNGDDTNASFYAGLLVSAFAVAEALTSMFWGAVSDHYGRKPVVLFGLCGVGISSLIFGLAKTYWVALLARFIGGALNGNISVMQTMVAEMVKKPEHEPKAYAVQPFVWFLGSIIGSAMGGFLARPADFYPDIFPKDGLFGRYPYLLPNLVAVAVIVIAIIQGIIFLDETNPRFKKEYQHLVEPGQAQPDGPAEAPRAEEDENSPLLRVISHPKSILESLRHAEPVFEEESLPIPTSQRFELRHNSFGTIHSIQVRPHLDDIVGGEPSTSTQEQSRSSQPDSSQRIFNTAVIMIIASLVIATFHQMAFSAILPIYLLDQPSNGANATSPHLDLRGGMGYSLHDVGAYLAANGFIALAIQGIIFPIFVERMGLWLSFLLPVLVYPLAYIVLPFLSLLRSLPESESSWALPTGIYASLVLQNFVGIIFTPCALIMLKNATPDPLVLGRVNGLAMSAICIARTISSPLVGVVYDNGGSGAAWLSCTVIALLGCAQLWWVPKRTAVSGKEAEVHVENVLVHHTSHEPHPNVVIGEED